MKILGNSISDEFLLFLGEAVKNTRFEDIVEGFQNQKKLKKFMKPFLIYSHFEMIRDMDNEENNNI